ncbi:DoxX family protein [Brevundimonas sp.]|uniref:DoxX family protein n=1 Tax=Brevundimonas sp. TaxID=1871086 RepID=UPI002D4C6288|nr:DoxX family protein [Brevundimonas sp.]HYC96860.1 DoxX family protein [Brevundimonas sp.]
MNISNAAATGGRLALALIFILSGAGKLAALEATRGYIQSVGLPAADVALWGAIAMELLGGLALAVGFQTRPAAVLLAGFSILTAILFHARFADQNQMIHFMKNVAITGGLLQVAVLGATAFSLDAVIKRGRSRLAQSALT